MSWPRVFAARVRGLVFRDRLESQLEDEFRFHLEMQAEDNLRTGMNPSEAHYDAVRRFGGIESVKEEYRESRTFAAIETLLRDVRYAIRTLGQNPGFTAVTVMTLALGIGVNAAFFTVTNAVLFRGCRLVDRNDRILYIHSERNGQYSGVSYPDFEDWRTQARSFDGMGTVADLRITLNDQSGFPERYTATRITTNAFRLLGQNPIIGRDFASSDAIPGAAPVAILSYGFWVRRFGKDPAIIGQTLQINGTPLTIVIGVMPAGFSFPQNQDLWIPLVPTADLQRRDARTLWFVFGRMADGATIESARAELETIGRRLANAYPLSNQGQVPRPHNFAEFFIGPSATMMYGAMWGAVVFVLLIACANLANLLLARAIGRFRDISVRMALGAGRWRIIRQLLIESVLLAAIGGFFGWWIAKWGVRAYELATNPAVGEWRRDLLDYSMDYRVLAYVMAISIGTGLLFGFAPALRFARLDLNTVLKDGGRAATGGGRGNRLSGLLVTGEVTLAVVLLTGAGVMIRSFLNIYTADIGVRTADTRTMLLHLPEAKYPHRKEQISFVDSLKTRLEAIPSVESASIGPPPAGGIPGRRPYELAGSGPVDERSRPTIAVATIGPDYFRTLGATVLSGREFNKFDGVSGVLAAVVNQRFATQYWRGENAVGQRLRLFDGKTPEAWLTVVGVVSNIVYDANRQEITPLVYLPYYGQRPRVGDMWVLVRTPLSAGELVTAFRREISSLDRDAVIWLGPYNFDDRARATGGLYGDIRTHTVLFLIFAAVALMLASISLYAVIAHSVSKRTQEIGVRMAVGATARDILHLVFKERMLQVAIGLTIGLLGSFAVNRTLKSELVQVSSADPITLGFASAVLIFSAALGCWIPARRAMRVDPAVALRHD